MTTPAPQPGQPTDERYAPDQSADDQPTTDGQLTDDPAGGRDEVTVLFARALEGDQAADLELGDRGFGAPGFGEGDPRALRAFMALRGAEIERFDRGGWPPALELTIAEVDQREARARDAIAAAVARVAVRQRPAE